MKRWVAAVAIGVLTLTAAGSARAFSFLEKAYGTPDPGLSARQRAMGGAGSALGNGIYSLVDNPGALVLTRGTRVQFDLTAARSSENRFVPIFDTFDSYVDENAIAVNDEAYGGFQGGLLLDAWEGEGNLDRLRIAAALFTRYDARYDYTDERRSTATSDDIISNRFIETEGVIRTLTVGAAYDLDGRGSGVGAALNYYIGTINDRDALIPTATNRDPAITELERELSGVSLTLGAVGRVNERLQVGASIETAPKLDDDYTLWVNQSVVEPDTATNGDLDLPLRFQAGAVYQPRNTLATTFAADVVYMPWSDLEDHLNGGLELEDTWEFRFGLEHVFYNDVAGRIGFRYGEAYALEEADKATFTFGFGYVLDNLVVDLAGEVGKRNSRQDPLRPRDEQSNAVGAGRDRVEDTLVRGVFGVSYSFD